eukprot:g14066.t1
MGGVGSRRSQVNRYVEYLEDSFGVGRADPLMSLEVEQYMEREGHRKYEVRCALRLPELAALVADKQELQVEGLFDVLPLTWSCWKRLFELRENLYEPVKEGTDRCLALVLRFLDAPAPEESEDGTLKPKANFGSEKCLRDGDREFTIREWRSNWQLELKTRLINLGAQPQVWERHVSLRDDAGEKLLVKCREDAGFQGGPLFPCDKYPYVMYSNSSLKGQPIRFPVTVTVGACVLQDRWAEPAECVVRCD